MNEKNQSFKDAIKSYLDRRAGQDELFAKTYAKEGKTLEECCNYIIGEEAGWNTFGLFLLVIAVIALLTQEDEEDWT